MEIYIEYCIWRYLNMVHLILPNFDIPQKVNNAIFRSLSFTFIIK